mgnify:CR=1 FL=1|tara:strand:- start:54 stop:308 length:255 start_codon:yes stop_codon:yes gene_type:complete
MAKKIIDTVTVTISKNVETGKVLASCEAIARLPEIDNTRFSVNVEMAGDGVTSLINSAIDALKVKMAEGGHTVEDAQPPAEEEG